MTTQFVNTQPQKRLHCDFEARYIINIRPSHEFHGGRFILLWLARHSKGEADEAHVDNHWGR